MLAVHPKKTWPNLKIGSGSVRWVAAGIGLYASTLGKARHPVSRSVGESCPNTRVKVSGISGPMF
jgi:hypothetical protein